MGESRPSRTVAISRQVIESPGRFSPDHDSRIRKIDHGALLISFIAMGVYDSIDA